MALNPFFLQGSPEEQDLIQSLVNEQLKIYGVEVTYIPRKFVNRSTVFQEIEASKFDDNFQLEAYVNTWDGYSGAGDVLTKFGMSLRDELQLVISRERFEDFISPFLSQEDVDEVGEAVMRPREGDLVFFPLGGRLFEIKFVEHEVPFYQLGNTYVYELQCELFEYSQEDFDTGIGDIDIIEDEQAYTTVMTMASGNGQNYVVNENITKSGTVVGEVVAWNNITSKLTIKDVTTTLATTDVLVGATSTAQYTINSIDDRMIFSNDASAQNKDFEDQDTNYLDLSEVNPFGEP